MVRNYKRKTEDRWSKEDLLEALTNIKEAKIKINDAARQYKISRATLYRQFKKFLQAGGKCDVNQFRTCGGNPILTKVEEDVLEKTIRDLREQGFTVTSSDIKRICFEYCDSNGIPNQFNQEKRMASDDWYYGFLKRHPDVKLDTSSSSSSSAAASSTTPKPAEKHKKRSDGKQDGKSPPKSGPSSAGVSGKGGNKGGKRKGGVFGKRGGKKGKKAESDVIVKQEEDLDQYDDDDDDDDEEEEEEGDYEEAADHPETDASSKADEEEEEDGGEDEDGEEEEEDEEEEEEDEEEDDE